jgi:hypothetical protein
MQGASARNEMRLRDLVVGFLEVFHDKGGYVLAQPGVYVYMSAYRLNQHVLLVV